MFIVSHINNSPKMLTVLCLIILCLVTGWIFKKKKHAPPQFPGGLPFIGNSLQLISGDSERFWSNLKAFSNYCMENGGIMTLSTFAYTVYIVSDPDAYASITTKCLEKPFMYSFARDVFGEGLIISEEKVWKDDRKKIYPAFSQQRINDFNGIFNTYARKFVEKLSAYVGKPPVDISEDLLDSLIKVVCGTTMGLSAHDNITTTYAQTMDELLNLFVLRFQKPWLVLPVIYKRTIYKKREDDYIKTIKTITEKVVETQKSKFHHPDDIKSPGILTFLDVLIEEGSFTDTQLRDHSDMMVVASYDTSRQSLLFTLMFLAEHKNVQERLYRELQDVLGNSDADLDKYDLAKLEYLDAVVKESLRVRPPLPIIGRHLQEDTKIKDYLLTKGSVVIMSIYGLNRHPMWGPDADQFRPERWLEPGGVPANPNALATFGIGKRSCIGKQYAFNFLKVFLAKTLLKYRVSGDGDEVVMKYEVLLKPKSGHQLSFELRQECPI